MSNLGKGSSQAPSASEEELKIFINYRREDTGGQALLLSRELKKRFGEDNVYFDVDQRPGIRWLEEIKDRGASAGVFLALIGPHWETSLKTRTEQVAAGGGIDYVRSEIEWALLEWRGRIMPVLVDTRMPAAERLPRSIEGLGARQAAQLRHTSFDEDLETLIRELEDVGRPAAPSEDLGAGDVRVSPRLERPPTAAIVSSPSEEHYVSVINSMLKGRIVPLLGPSVRGSLPDARYLATRLADEFHLQREEPDLAEVAQHVAVTEGTGELYAAIKDILAAGSAPMPVHEFLAQFPGLLREHNVRVRPQLIISTNYDCALEAAFDTAGEPFDYVVYDSDQGHFVHIPWGEDASTREAVTITAPGTYFKFPMLDYDLTRTVIVKIHGAADAKFRALIAPDHFVVTEDHYIDYLPTEIIQDHLPIQIVQKLKGSRCLFLGYTLRDWNARVILRRIWKGEPLSENSWAILHEPDAFEKSAWSMVGHVEILAAHSTDYVNGLRSALADRLKRQPASQVSPG